MENISQLKKHLTPDENEALTSLQRNLQSEFEQGGNVTYFGKRFKVLPGVFPPRPDSISLVQSMEINPGDQILDVCCGSGVIGIFAGEQGGCESGVLGLDFNPAAVRCAEQNSMKFGVKNYTARVSNGLNALKSNEIFDVVTFNPPYRNLPAPKMIEKTMWDEDFAVHRNFFANIRYHLKPSGRIYFAQANFGDLDQVEALLTKYRWNTTLLGERDLTAIPGLKFYAFLIS